MNQILQSSTSNTNMVTINLPPPFPPPSRSPSHSHTSNPSPPVHHRQNRRRERPGSRARRAIPRKSALATDLNEGILEARDSSFYIPTHRSGNGPSPVLRQNFEQSWLRWKARQAAELQLLAVKENLKRLEMQRKRETMIGEAKGRKEREEEKELGKLQRRLFGGEDDDEDVSCDIDLCPAMLDVVMRLFDGEIDYLDP